MHISKYSKYFSFLSEILYTKTKTNLKNKIAKQHIHTWLMLVFKSFSFSSEILISFLCKMATCLLPLYVNYS